MKKFFWLLLSFLIILWSIILFIRPIFWLTPRESPLGLSSYLNLYRFYNQISKIDSGILILSLSKEAKTFSENEIQSHQIFVRNNKKFLWQCYWKDKTKFLGLELPFREARLFIDTDEILSTNNVEFNSAVNSALSYCLTNLLNDVDSLSRNKVSEDFQKMKIFNNGNILKLK